MKRRNILLATGAVVLTVASAFAGRVSAKFGTAAALYYTGGGVFSCTPIQASGISSSLLTTGATTNQAVLTTAGSGKTQMKLYSTSNCSTGRKVHFNG